MKAIWELVVVLFRFYQLIQSEKDIERRKDATRRLDVSLRFAQETKDTSLLEQAIRQTFHTPFKK